MLVGATAGKCWPACPRCAAMQACSTFPELCIHEDDATNCTRPRSHLGTPFRASSVLLFAALTFGAAGAVQAQSGSTSSPSQPPSPSSGRQQQPAAPQPPLAAARPPPAARAAALTAPMPTAAACLARGHRRFPAIGERPVLGQEPGQDALARRGLKRAPGLEPFHDLQSLVAHSAPLQWAGRCCREQRRLQTGGSHP